MRSCSKRIVSFIYIITTVVYQQYVVLPLGLMGLLKITGKWILGVIVLKMHEKSQRGYPKEGVWPEIDSKLQTILLKLQGVIKKSVFSPFQKLMIWQIFVLKH